jgi:hypothetical protein
MSFYKPDRGKINYAVSRRFYRIILIVMHLRLSGREKIKSIIELKSYYGKFGPVQRRYFNFCLKININESQWEQ